MKHVKAPQPANPQDQGNLLKAIADILEQVRSQGDTALRTFTEQFDKVRLDSLEVTEKQISDALAGLDPELDRDMRYGIERITDFARRQRETMKELECEPRPGVHLGHRHIPVSRAGCYVPGGRYPLLSAAQMSIIPAKVAGVEEVIACTPPNTHPAVIAAAHLAGADRIFQVGGAQAIAAMAFGTESVPAVDIIVGPGNKYVTEAKRQVFGTVGLDQLAGPSEIYTLADDSGDPRWIAADLLGQAEHDTASRAGLVTTSSELAEATLKEVERQLSTLSTAQVAGEAWERHGEITLCDDMDAAIAYMDRIAPEHLQVHTRDAHQVARRLHNYGSLFIGREASVVYSDKICGTNHILPTGTNARYTGGLWVGTFLKTCTHQWLEQAGVEEIAPYAVRQSEREGMEGHRRAAALRLDDTAV